MKKYAIHPGWVGDKWISFERLVKLYGVPRAQRISVQAEGYHPSEDLIHLHPREDAVYHSPEKTEAQQ